jgi:type IV pilus assembly protein PilX
MIRRRPIASAERGMVLISSMLLLLVVTILAVGLFRGFGIDEKIAGNTREKQLALNAAESSEQFAEWWISTGANGAGIVITPSCTVPAAAGTVGQVCQNALPNVTTLPWTAGVTYPLPEVGIGVAARFSFANPSFYIQQIAPINGSNVYQIDAAGYGGDPNTTAVVEATFICVQKVTPPLSNPGNGGPTGTIC